MTKLPSMTRNERLGEINFGIFTLTEKISIRLGKPLPPEIPSSLTKQGGDLFDTYSLLGWKTVGQQIVYGEERRLGFALSAELSGNLERHVKLMKKHKCLDKEMFSAAYTYHYLSAIQQRLEDNS